MLPYNQGKDSLLEIIERLSGSVRGETGRSLAKVKAKLEEEAFNLVILGQFKRGKSTFINALLGESLLPTAIVPLTSVVTILRYGPELRIEVHYQNDKRETIDLAGLPSLITERRLRVREETAAQRGDKRTARGPLIDVAYNYLPYVDAGVFIVSADPPLSESEHQFLKDIRGYVDKLFFALNKIDQVSDEDRQESLEFTAQILEKVLGVGCVKIFPLSARWALEAKQEGNGAQLERSALPDFERRLQEFLIHGKGRVFLKSVVNNLLKLISDETVSFQLEQEAVKLPLQELTAKTDRFEQEMKTVSKDREHNGYLLSGHLKTITSGLDEAIGAFKRDSLPVLHQELDNEYARLVRRGAGNLRSELEEFMFEMVRDRFTGWRQHLTETISAQLEEAHRWFATGTNETIERIHALTSDIFELKLKPFTSVEMLSTAPHNKMSEYR